MRLLRALVPILSVTAISAADDLEALASGKEQLPWVEIRLGVGRAVAPDIYPVDVTIFNSGATFQMTDQMTQNTATSYSYGIVGGDLSPAGLVGGIEMVYSQSNQHLKSRSINGVPVSVPADSPTVRYSTLGGNALLGGGLALGSKARLELLGVLGGGGLRQGFINNTFTQQQSGSGWYWNYGLRGGAYYRIGRFVLGGIVEYSHIKSEASKDWTTGSTTTSTDADGIGYRLEIGYHIQ